MTMEPRAALIIAATRKSLRETGRTLRHFAAELIDHYHARTHVDDRTVRFHRTDNPYKDEEANTQIVDRMLSGLVRMPVDIEEAWVLAIADPYRRELLNELAARYGLSLIHI